MGLPWGRSGSPLSRPAALQRAHLNTSFLATAGFQSLLRTVYNHLATSTQKGSAGRSINQIRVPRCQVCAERLRPAPTVELEKEHNQTT